MKSLKRTAIAWAKKEEQANLLTLNVVNLVSEYKIVKDTVYQILRDSFPNRPIGRLRKMADGIMQLAKPEAAPIRERLAKGEIDFWTAIAIVRFPQTISPMTPAELERRKEKTRSYYDTHRDEIKVKQRQYYAEYRQKEE